jgi:hypothetical protein
MAGYRTKPIDIDVAWSGPAAGSRPVELAAPGSNIAQVSVRILTAGSLFRLHFGQGADGIPVVQGDIFEFSEQSPEWRAGVYYSLPDVLFGGQQANILLVYSDNG